MNSMSLGMTIASIIVIFTVFLAGCTGQPVSPVVPSPGQPTPTISSPPTAITETTRMTTSKPTPVAAKLVSARARQEGNDIVIEYLGGPGHQNVDDITWEVYPGKKMYQEIPGIGTFPLESRKGYDLAPKEHFTAVVDGLGTTEKDHVVVVASYHVSPFFETILDTYV